MMSLALKTLLDLNLIDKDRYESIVLRTLANKDIITIEDLLNMPNPNTFHGIGKKKMMLILELQECVRQLRSCDSNTTLTVKKYGANNNHSDDILESPIIEQLASIPVEEIGRYIKCGTIPQSVQKVGVSSLKDLWYKNFDSVTTLGFCKRKAKDLQNKFREFSHEQLEDIVFWNTNRELPLKYDADIAIEVNLQLVLDELIGYIDGCVSREHQISGNNDKKRAKFLKHILHRRYQENIDKKDIANELRFEVERIRQLLYLELLDPLFRGEKLNYDIFKNISINSDLVKKVKDFRANILFKSYFVKDGCSTTFFEDVIGVDILQHRPLSYIVPSQEEMCYRSVIKAFFDEMTAIMEHTPAEELVKIIDKNEIIQRDIYNRNKTYDKRFVEHLLSNEDIIIKNEVGVKLKPEYIRNFGLYELGGVIQERALARIIADAPRTLHESEIVDTYHNQYGEEIDEVAIRRTQDFGCQCIAHKHWKYCKDELLSRPKFIERFVQREAPFYLQEVIDALKKNGYPVESEEIVRMYVSQYNCASHREIKQYFCHRDYLENNGGYEKWATRKASGLNWMANAIKFLFDQQGVNELGGEKVVQYLNDNIIGSPYEGRSIELNHLNTYLGHRSDSPFNITRVNDEEWILSKSNQYESTDWEFYGTRGNHSYHHYLVANAESIRRRMSYHPTLQELATKLYEEKGEEILGDENSEIREGADRKRRIVFKIRQQLEAAINNNYLDHALKIVKRDRNVYVTLDARRVNAQKTTRYISQNPEIRIEYKSVSQLNELDWGKLIPILRSELSFCQVWMDADNLGAEYNEVFDKFINFIKTDYNPNLNKILPQRLYEFFAVSDPTSDDRYCIMCNIAKNFEAFLDSIYRRKRIRGYDDNYNRVNGIFEKTQKYNFEDFTNILHNNCNIMTLRSGSYQRALKYLNFVRNTDAHGQWYEDRNATDYLTEDQRNVQKILNFAALYIFTYAKYAM